MATAAALLASLSAGAHGDLFRWREGRLVPVQTPPAAPATPPAPTTSPIDAIAGLRFEPRGDRIEVWADNRLAGPIEVELRPVDPRFTGAEPSLPIRDVIAGRDRRLLARLPAGTTAQFDLDAVRGAPAPRVQDVEYAYPLRSDALAIEQGWGGGFSHSDPENRYGVDFAADIGTLVLAARGGTVMEVDDGHGPGGGDRARDAARANIVRILHDDGSMALYAHLDTGGALVRPGQRVRRGEPIARSGNSGYTTGPHLHFAVQVNRGMRLESIPFRMFGPQGILRFSEAN
jgi:murein DD-endopeptidase MepM/ murein hydrolase activator NlpD